MLISYDRDMLIEKDYIHNKVIHNASFITLWYNHPLIRRLFAHTNTYILTAWPSEFLLLNLPILSYVKPFV